MYGSADNMSRMSCRLLMFIDNSCENKVSKPYCDQAPRPDYLINTDFVLLKNN